MVFKVHHFVKLAKTSLANRAGSRLHGKMLGQPGMFLYPWGEKKRKETLLQITLDLKFLL